MNGDPRKKGYPPAKQGAAASLFVNRFSYQSGTKLALIFIFRRIYPEQDVIASSAAGFLEKI